jgi:hypothetical protein
MLNGRKRKRAATARAQRLSGTAAGGLGGAVEDGENDEQVGRDFLGREGWKEERRDCYGGKERD